ncbi:triose-phosphate isomerase [Oceanicoccus sp. KOV_DT_Chl]|uniref:triose-phosphate isomerase n=1 Tax=Oceanicoccus sp. KOV_DT_Chl TaxID=1904639 RepID=UPI000C7A8DC9|nr:triose-phosphate isomerase [Oceanicoccus sp. KOV_DT_Chl]
MRRGLVVGNWKMHGSKASVAELVTGLKRLTSHADADLAVCPPYVFIPSVVDGLAATDITVGAQNVSDQAEGAFTGEVSAGMLAEFGCRYVIVGHSERRTLFADSDKLVAAKFVAAQQVGLTPILCVGESLAQREAGETLTLVEEQLLAVIDSAGIQALSKAVVAYEPIWAIGTGKTASPEQAQQVHAHIRQVVAKASSTVAAGLQILYGGSVKADNAAELFANQDIDGALVGGASLQIEDFAAIYNAAG